MSEETCNGYANYETYAFVVNVCKEPSEYERHKEMALQAYEESDRDKEETINSIKNYLEQGIEENKPETTGIYAKLLTSAIAEIDTWQVAETLYYEFIGE